MRKRCRAQPVAQRRLRFHNSPIATFFLIPVAPSGYRLPPSLNDSRRRGGPPLRQIVQRADNQPLPEDHVRTASWRRALFVSAVAFVTFAPGRLARAQELPRPDDATPPVV